MLPNGIIVPIVHMEFFDFSFLAATGSQTLVLARALNVVPFRRLGLLTRVHVNGLGSGTSIDIQVSNVFPSERDQQRFAQTATITRNLTNSDTAPALLSDFASDMGPFVEVALVANQDTGSQNAVQAQLSIDLLLRDNA